MGQYPNNDAASQRLHLLASMLVEKGHEILVISRNKENKSGVVGGVTYKSGYSNPTSKMELLIDVYKVFPNVVKKEINEFAPHAILLISAPTSLVNWLCRNKKGFALFHDSVEWYSKEEYKHPFLSIEYLKKQLWMNKILPGNFSIIAISRYLQNYFLEKGNRCILIPSICDCNSIAYEINRPSDPVTITYAGSPGRKDRFSEIISALLGLNKEERGRIKLQIIGATKKEIAENAGVGNDALSKLNTTITFLGRVPREKVYEYLSKSDYTILIRPQNARYAMAGFPTKVPESLAAGTPVISNLTSDLELYLNDSNSIIVENCTVESVSAALRKVLCMDDSKSIDMKKNARDTAERFFNYKIYENILDSFIRGDNDESI